MNADQIQSIIRKGAVAVGTLLSVIGIVPIDKWATFANAVYGAVGALAAVLGPATVVASAVWGWYKQSAAAKIAAINIGGNGVKVVADSAANRGVPQVNAPLK